MSSIIQVNDYSFICTDNTITLLEAIERENITINYQCRQGFCGACKVKLISGNVEYIEEPLAFIPQDYILSCCCKIKNDITIECDTLNKSKNKQKKQIKRYQ